MAHDHFFTLAEENAASPVTSRVQAGSDGIESDLLDLVAQLRRAADHEECLDLLVEALVELPGVDSVHVSLRDGGDTGPGLTGEDWAESLERVFVVRQGGDIPHVWPTTEHAWRPRAGDRALHRALQTGRSWEGVVGSEPAPKRPVAAGTLTRDRRFAAAFPLLTDRGVVGQVLLTARHRFDDTDLAIAQTVTGAVGPVLRPPRSGSPVSTREEELVTSVARLLRARPDTEVSLVTAALPPSDESAAGPDDGTRVLRDLREELHDQVGDWPGAMVLGGRSDEIFVLAAAVSASEAAFRTAELRESARRSLPDSGLRWGVMTVSDVEDMAPHIRHTAAAFIELARATRDADGPLGPPASPRSHPGVSSDRLVVLVAEVLNELDAMVDSPVGERLALVAARSASAMSAAAWQVSQIRDDVARSTQLEIDRSPTAHAEEPCPLFGRIDLPLSRRPAMARSAEGWAFHADLTRGDPAERLSLAVNGYRSVVCAGGYDPAARRWVVQLFGDDRSVVPETLAGMVLSLVQAALSFPRTATTPSPDEDRDSPFL